MTVNLHWSRVNEGLIEAWFFGIPITICRGWFAENPYHFAWKFRVGSNSYRGEEPTVLEAQTAVESKIKEILVSNGVY